MALDDEAVRQTLLWLCEEQTAWDGIESNMFQAPCATCGHDRRDHVVGGDADNPTPWPCNFPHSRGAPAILCYCGDYEPMREDPDEQV
jgi:hypothetical protein